jgi:glycosyltransferase involved in cell wall biosynthesis
MTSREPLVGVVVAVKNGERFLSEAIASIVAQTYPHREIVVVDGGSSDRSAEIARSFPEVRCIAQRGDGLAGAWNQGVEAARGELIAFLDSDDRWIPDKLERQVELLAREPELGGVIGRVRFTLEPGLRPPAGFRPELLEGDHPAQMPGALLVRREVFQRIGDFDPSYGVTMDIDWFARVKDAGLRFGELAQVVIEKRLHDSNLSHADGELYAREVLRAMRDSASRQGSGPKGAAAR